MRIPIQKNIHCEPCKECGARPVVEQLPKAKFKVLCPTCGIRNSTPPGLFDVDKWNLLNLVVQPGVLRKVS